MGCCAQRPVGYTRQMQIQRTARELQRHCKAGNRGKGVLCARTCGDLFQGGGEVGGLNGSKHAVPEHDEWQGQAPYGHQHQCHEVRRQKHVRQHRYACATTSTFSAIETSQAGSVLREQNQCHADKASTFSTMRAASVACRQCMHDHSHASRFTTLSTMQAIHHHADCAK